MTKLEIMKGLNKVQGAVQKLPNDFDIAEAEVDYNGRLRVRIYMDDATPLLAYAESSSLYSKVVKDEFDHYDGVHVLDDSGVELYAMVNYRCDS